MARDPSYDKKRTDMDAVAYAYLLSALANPDDDGSTAFGRLVSGLRKLLPGVTSEDIANSGYGTLDPLRISYAKDLSPDKWKARMSAVISCLDASGDALAGSSVESGDDESVTGMNLDGYRETVSFALTAASYLMYSVRMGRVPTNVEFSRSVTAETVSTFAVRPFTDIDVLIEFLRNRKLSDSRDLTVNGYRVSVVMAKRIVTAGVLCGDGSIDDMSAKWRTLSDAGK